MVLVLVLFQQFYVYKTLFFWVCFRYRSPTDSMMSPVTKGLLARNRKAGGGSLLPPSINQTKVYFEAYSRLFSVIHMRITVFIYCVKSMFQIHELHVQDVGFSQKWRGGSVCLIYKFTSKKECLWDVSLVPFFFLLWTLRGELNPGFLVIFLKFFNANFVPTVK